jgi:hypothetical protein
LATTFDPTPGVIVAHPLGIPDFLHVVHGYPELLTESASTGGAAGRAAGPLTIGGHQHDCQRCDAGLGLDECLDPGAQRSPVPQMFLVGGNI